MKTMNRKIGAALAAMMILTMLGGCQLAVTDDVAAAGQDTLIGVFATLEPLDFGMEGTIELPPDWNGNIDDIIQSQESQKIYAKRVNSKSGDTDYIFEGLDGSRFFVPSMAQGNEKYHATVVDSAIADVQMAFSDTDMKLTGTLMFDVHEPCHVYANPVYQTPEGDVYMVQGQGLWFDELQTEGSGGSTKLSATTTETTDSVQSTRTSEVELKIEAVNTNREIVLKQMDKEDRIIARTSIAPDHIPESVQVLGDTAYMILEEHGADYEDKEVVKRTLLKADEQSFNARFTGENGIVHSTYVTLTLPEGQTNAA
jgi:hypothetical protein